VQYLKGRSSNKLLAEFASSCKRYWGQHLWAWGYWASSSGNVTDEVWMEYIKSQTQPEPDADFSCDLSPLNEGPIRLSAVH
jgi:putative transposase